MAGEAGGGGAAELEVLVGSVTGPGVDVAASPGSSPSATAATSTADAFELDAPPDTTAVVASPSVASGSAAGAASA